MLVVGLSKAKCQMFLGFMKFYSLSSDVNIRNKNPQFFFPNIGFSSQSQGGGGGVPPLVKNQSFP